MKKYQDPQVKWVVYANIPRPLWDEFRKLGLVHQIDDIVETAIEDAITLKKDGGK